MAVDLGGMLFAFTVGGLTLFSPCGFAMLPGYISYYMGGKASRQRAVATGLTCALGLISVFLLIGLAASVASSILIGYIPMLEIAAGAIVILMGVSILMEISIPAPKLATGFSERKGLLGILVFGVAYGLASLGCSAPLFYSVILYSLASGGFLTALATFISYATGMGVPLVAITILAAKAKSVVLEKIASLTPKIRKASGLVLIAVGIYLIAYYYLVFYAAR